MDIQVRQQAGIYIAALSGKIDATTSEDLEDALMGLIEEGANNILLDMTGVSYLSSAGLRILLLIAKHLYGGGQLALCSLQDGVAEIIEMAGFASFMTIFPSLDEACQQMLA